ncbi:unnamed protein product [Prorocentrum cordatum]|uniref:Uncharacterized protein n=1 Tax=Prorocentrum cordatum TaxID=2364126 RepID=A0ABN9TT40_9DINO|nr:unnamed protein product [Polarella glacialis]
MPTPRASLSPCKMGGKQGVSWHGVPLYGRPRHNAWLSAGTKETAGWPRSTQLHHRQISAHSDDYQRHPRSPPRRKIGREDEEEDDDEEEEEAEEEPARPWTAPCSPHGQRPADPPDSPAGAAARESAAALPAERLQLLPGRVVPLQDLQALLPRARLPQLGDLGRQLVGALLGVAADHLPDPAPAALASPVVAVRVVGGVYGRHTPPLSVVAHWRRLWRRLRRRLRRRLPCGPS